MVDVRAEFLALYHRLQRLQKKRWTRRDRQNDRYMAHTARLFQASLIKRRKPTDKARTAWFLANQELVQALQAGYLWTWEAREVRMDRYKKHLEALLKARAKSVVRPEPGPWRVWKTVDSGCWRSQTDPINYARGEAENLADVPRKYSLEVQVRLTEEHDGGGRWSVPHGTFVVEVQGDEATVAALGYVPAPSLKEWLAACWRRGCNPRVYNPWLPHGLEERLGVDYFGNVREATRENTPCV